MSTSQVAAVDEPGGWRRLVLQAPPGHILTETLTRTIRQEVERAAAVPGLRWLTLEGQGAHFSYGASIPEHLPEPMRTFLPAMHCLCRDLLEFPAPTAALVQGQCLGGGLELALCCDDVIASEDAVLGLPEIALGAFPPVAAALLPWRIGASRASRRIVTGRAENASVWHAAGLVGAVTPSGALLDHARSWFTEHLAPRSAVALSHAARAARRAWLPSVLETIEAGERTYLDELLQTADAVEGIQAWMEKRAPRWRDA